MYLEIIQATPKRSRLNRGFGQTQSRGTCRVPAPCTKERGGTVTNLEKAYLKGN